MVSGDGGDRAPGDARPLCYSQIDRLTSIIHNVMLGLGQTDASV